MGNKAALVLACVVGMSAMARADDAPSGALWQQTLDTYRQAKTFRCEIVEDDVMDGAGQPFHSRRTGSIRFVRPDGWRIVWNDTQLGGDVVPSAVFVRQGKLLLYWGTFRLWGPQKSIDDSLGSNAGISGGITYTLPSLLLGQKGYFHGTFAPGGSESVEGKQCVLIKGTTGDRRTYEIAVDPAARAIVRIREETVIRRSDLDAARKEMEKNHPDLAARMAAIPSQPDRTLHKTTTFSAIAFDVPIPEEELDFAVPKEARYVDDVSAAATAATGK